MPVRCWKPVATTVSAADVSARVNISKASIHHHFPSKADLVRTVVELYRAEAREGLALLDRQLDDPLQELNAYVDYWSSCIAGVRPRSASARCWPPKRR
jgi:TetR/AcrR family transcriptional repressor of nem operon